MSDYDCAVIGAGMVGATTALALADIGLKVVLIDKYPVTDFSPEQAFDLRVSAISLASEQLLTQLGAWHQRQHDPVDPSHHRPQQPDRQPDGGDDNKTSQKRGLQPGKQPGAARRRRGVVEWRVHCLLSNWLACKLGTVAPRYNGFARGRFRLSQSLTNSLAISAASRALLRTSAILASSERPSVSSKIRCSRKGVTSLPTTP